MIEIYTDGSSNPKTNLAAGWAFVIMPFSEGLPHHVYFGHLPPPSTNNIAEMLGVLNSMKLLYNFSGKGSKSIPKAIIYSDSQYVLKGLLEWRSKWEYEGMPEKNVSYWYELFETHDLLKTVCDISFKWVKGHSGISGNELADEWCGNAKRDSNFSINNNWIVTHKIVGKFA